jgi:hypothetical protein
LWNVGAERRKIPTTHIKLQTTTATIIMIIIIIIYKMCKSEGGTLRPILGFCPPCPSSPHHCL